MAEANFNMGDAVHGMTLQVQLAGGRRVAVRLWLAVRLIRLAAWVGGFGGVEIEGDSEV